MFSKVKAFFIESSQKLTVKSGGGGDDGASSRSSQHPSQLEIVAGFSFPFVLEVSYIEFHFYRIDRLPYLLGLLCP